MKKIIYCCVIVFILAIVASCNEGLPDSVVDGSMNDSLYDFAPCEFDSIVKN